MRGNGRQESYLTPSKELTAREDALKKSLLSVLKNEQELIEENAP